MNIVVATTQFKADCNEAISKNLVHLCGSLTQRGDEVTLLVPGALPDRDDLDFSCRSFAPPHPYGSARHLVSNLRSLRTALKELDYSNVDLVHLHAGFPVELTLLGRIHDEVPVPIVITIWQPYLEMSEVRLLLRRGRVGLLTNSAAHALVNTNLLRPLYRRSAANAAAIVVASEVQRQQVQSFFPADRIIRAPNGVSPAHVDPTNGAHSEPLRLLYIGHYTPNKGVNEILSALAKLKDDHEFTMTFALSDRGDLGPFYSMVNDLGLESVVRVKGTVDVYEEMGRHDLFVVPYAMSVGVSYYPNVILECISSALPFVSTTIPVMEELCGPEARQLLVPPHDPDALARKLGWILDTPAALNEIRMELEEQYKECFTLERWVDTMRDVYYRFGRLRERSS